MTVKTDDITKGGKDLDPHRQLRAVQGRMGYAYLTIFLLLSLQKELQNLEDAGDELLMLEDDTAPIPYPYFKKKKNTMLACGFCGIFEPSRALIV